MTDIILLKHIVNFAQILGPLKLQHLKLEMKWSRPRRSVLCVRVSLGKTKSLGFIFSIFVGNCLCNKLSFFFKGILFLMNHGSVDLLWCAESSVVNNKAIGSSRLDRWAPRPRTCSLLASHGRTSLATLHRAHAAEKHASSVALRRSCFSASDRVLRVQICIHTPPHPAPPASF